MLEYSDIWKIITKILESSDKKYLIRHHIESYDYFLDNEITNIINDNNPIKIKKNHNNNELIITINIVNHKYSLPSFFDKDGRKNILLPENARNKKLTYSIPLYLDFDIETIYYKDNNISDIKKNKESNVFVGNIPLMVNSKYCILRNDFYNKDVDECKYDIGGYFIINGSDKVIISQERMADNKIYHFKMDTGKYSYISEVRCNKSISKMANVFRLKFLGDKNLNGKCIFHCSFSNLKDSIPVIVLFKYLGVKNDKDIIKYILYNYEDNHEKYVEYINLLKPSFIDYYQNIDESTPENYIKKFLINKTLSIDYIIDTKVLNMYDNNEQKLFYLGYMIKEMLDIILKKKKITDRDNFENKRIETSGILFTQLFRKLYNNTIKSIKYALQKEINPNLEIQINKYIKTNIIENGLRYSLATGNWNSKVGSDNKKIGVAQMFNRLTYSATLSHLRRLNAPVGSNGKMILPRKLHNSQFGYICAAESPEGAQIGLVKNLSLSTIISVNSNKDSLFYILDDFKCNKYNDLSNIDNKYTKILIDNILYYYTDDGIELYNKLKQYKKDGIIEYTTSIIFNYNENKLIINTEEGRVLRPFLVVENNKINITPEILEKIKNNNFTFDDLILNNIIEYIDIEEQNNIMLCDNITNLNNDYVKYTHCEIHPSLILGICASLIPFPDHNQSPRNTYQSAMGKQSIGYSLTNYNNRMDSFSYILHYPQRPIVYTQSGNLLGFNDLPAGDNLVIAIACHTGYNQEDSVIVNRGAIERGLFNVTFYRTYKSEEKKDMTSLAQEKFCIPDRDKCIGIRKGCYKNLDKNGLIKTESKVKGNDIIIGKITPITDKQFSTKKNIKYKDTSVQLRHNEDGIVDKVKLEYNSDGYRIANVKVRSTRSMEMADKMSSRHGQKGTIGLILDEEDMPFTEDGIIPDVIINPHCLSGDTLIKMSNGEVKYIKDIYNQDLEIETINPKTLEKEITKYKDGFKIFPKNKMYKLKTISGREVKCTEDHKFLIFDGKENIWKETKDIIPYQDKIFIKHTIKPLNDTNETILKLNFEPYFEKKLNKINFSNILNETQLRILVKLLGSLESDGHICKRSEKSYRTIFNLGEIEDCNELMKDVHYLGFRTTKYRREKNVYHIEVESCLGYILVLLGAQLGNKTNSLRNFPEWIMNSSKNIKRNFLSGYQGGDGSKVSINVKTIQQQIRIKPTNMRSNSEKNILESHINYLQKMQILFKEFNIETTIQKYKTKTLEKIDLKLYFKTDYQNINNYVDYIDYTYCHHKRRESGIAIEYLKCRMNNFKISYEHFKKLFCKNTTFIESIEEIEKEYVYDFTTISNNHSFIANSFISHNCIPSRMTIAQLIECIMGKIGSCKGKYFDGTPFENVNTDNLMNELDNLGFENKGYETLYNGETGEKIKSKIFIGPTFYQRLKHMVKDKIHARSRGPNQILTRQPAEGRSRDGGLRLGEMETDCILSHGAAYFLKEKTFDCSDSFEVYICNKCGIISIYNEQKNIYECRKCDNKSYFSKINLPYSTKLLFMEIQSMNVNTQFIINENMNVINK